MMDTIKKKLYLIFSSKTLRSLSVLPFILLLSACHEIIDPSGSDANYSSQANCWQTKIAHSVTKMVDSLYSTGTAEATKAGAAVILVGFAVWMAFKLLKVLASFKEENVGEVWNEIFQKLFVCAFCAYFVTAGDKVAEAMNTFVIPLYQQILDLGIQMLSLRNDSLGEIELGAFGKINFAHGVVSCPAVQVKVGALQDSVQPLSDCMICNINTRLNTGIKIGIGLITIPGFGPTLVGLLMMLLFTAAKFCFVLYVVDSLFRVNFAAFFLPLLIAGVPFSYTRKWSKHGLLMFLNSAGCMLFIGLLIGMAVGSLETIFYNLSKAGDLDPKEAEGVASTMLLSMVLISLLLINIPAQGVKLANTFIGGGQGMVFAQKVSKFIINSIKKVGAAALSFVTQGITRGITDTAEKYEATMEVVHDLKQKSQSISRSLNSLAGYNDDD